jgi:hypothetical protein
MATNSESGVPSPEFVAGYSKGAEDCRGSVDKIEAQAERIRVLEGYVRQQHQAITTALALVDGKFGLDDTRPIISVLQRVPGPAAVAVPR